MATWTTARTWVTGEVVTAAQGNEQWRDNMTFVKEMGENASIGVIFDGSGADISTDASYMLELPGPCTVEWGTLSSSNTGDISIDIRQEVASDMAAGGVFDSDDSILDPTFLTLSCDTYNKIAANSDWTTSLLENTVLRFHVISCTGIQNVSAQLGVHKG